MNKRLLKLFICLAVVALTVVLCAVVFAVGEITVDVIGDSEGVDTSQIVADSQIKLKSNIFALSENLAKSNIEKSNSYIKVISIERSFPNKIIITIVKRIPIVAIKCEDNLKFLLIDEDGIVVDMVNGDAINFNQTIVFKNYGLKNIDIDTIKGKIIPKVVEDATKIVEIVTGFGQIGFNDERLTALIGEVDYNFNNYIIANTRKGIRFALRTNTNLTLSEQIKSLYSYYNNLTDKTQELSDFIFITNNGVKQSKNLE